MTKREYRKQLLSMRSQIPAEQQRLVGHKISLRLLQQLELKPMSSVVCSYMAFRGEVDLREFHESVLAQGRRLLLPHTANGLMTFYEVSSLDTLILSSMGISEPDPSLCSPWETERIWETDPLVATPGVAFTPDGHRMGYGGGYYDRFFERRRQRGTTIGICHAMQVVDHLPTEAHDMLVDHLLFD